MHIIQSSAGFAMSTSGVVPFLKAGARKRRTGGVRKEKPKLGKCFVRSAPFKGRQRKKGKEMSRRCHPHNPLRQERLRQPKQLIQCLSDVVMKASQCDVAKGLAVCKPAPRPSTLMTVNLFLAFPSDQKFTGPSSSLDIPTAVPIPRTPR